MKVWLFMRVGYPKRVTGSYLLAGRDYDRALGKEIYDEVVSFCARWRTTALTVFSSPNTTAGQPMVYRRRRTCLSPWLRF